MLKMMLALVLQTSNQGIQGEESYNQKSVTSEI